MSLNISSTNKRCGIATYWGPPVKKPRQDLASRGLIDGIQTTAVRQFGIDHG
ncbi:hypothetical protein AAVH_37337, partial [Aphelenchoides avenae]